MMLIQVHSITPIHGRRSAIKANSATSEMTRMSRIGSGLHGRGRGGTRRGGYMADDVAELARALGGDLGHLLHLHGDALAQAPAEALLDGPHRGRVEAF